jgi:hypothetical protein
MSQQQSPDEPPHYVRWSPHRSPYAIELKLELVPRLINEIAAAERLGIEIGGVLIGSVTDSPSPLLRIEDFELVPRRPEDGIVYMLDPGQQQYLAGLRAGASATGMSAVGFFRSHLRPGPLRPSLADRSLLLGHSKDPVYAVLLVEAREPRMGAFFLASNGQLSTDPAVQEFRFGERGLRSAGEIRPNVSSETYHVGSERPSPAAEESPGLRRFGLVAVLLLIALATGIFSWPFLSGLLSSWNHLDLAVVGSDHILKISWNHALPEIGQATDALLVIADGTTRRVITLGPDELKFGVVEYERRTRQINITFTLNMPGSTSLSQSVEWHGSP